VPGLDSSPCHFCRPGIDGRGGNNRGLKNSGQDAHLGVLKPPLGEPLVSLNGPLRTLRRPSIVASRTLGFEL